MMEIAEAAQANARKARVMEIPPPKEALSLGEIRCHLVKGERMANGE
jgi:hypothetical protein